MEIPQVRELFVAGDHRRLLCGEASFHGKEDDAADAPRR
jgi:hypothetical protein